MSDPVITLVADLPERLYADIIDEVALSGLSIDEWVARNLAQSVQQSRNFRRMLAKETAGLVG